MLKSFPFHILNQTCFKGRGVIYPSTPSDSPFGEVSWRPLKCVSPMQKIGIHEGVYVFYRFFWSKWYNSHWSLVSQLGFPAPRCPHQPLEPQPQGSGECSAGTAGVGVFLFWIFWRGTSLKTNGWNPKIGGWGRCFSFSKEIFPSSKC